MFVAVCRLELHLPASQSLKDKRQVIKSILAKLKNRNMSVAETGSQDAHQRAELGFAVITISRNSAEDICRRTIDFIEDNYPVELISVDMEII